MPSRSCQLHHLCGLSPDHTEKRIALVPLCQSDGRVLDQAQGGYGIRSKGDEGLLHALAIGQQVRGQRSRQLCSVIQAALGTASFDLCNG